MQFDYSKQEAARLRQQLEYTERGLTETRQALTEERQKAGESLASSAQHTELLESIHTAKLLRESNQTLRDENEANIRKVTSLDSQLRQAQAEIEPLREQVRVLQAEVEAKQNNMRLLEEDNERWKTRNQTILAKYERIDPEELQVLKNEVERVQAILTSVEVEKADLAKQIEEKTAFVGARGSSIRRDPSYTDVSGGTGRIDATELAERSRPIQGAPDPSPKHSRRAQRPYERGRRAQSETRSWERRRGRSRRFSRCCSFESPPQLCTVNGSLCFHSEQAQAQSDPQAALAELQTRLTALEAERDALNAKLAEQQTEQSTNDDSLKSLQNRFAVLEQEKATVTAEKDRLAAREGPLFRDNVRSVLSFLIFVPDLS